MFFSKVGNKGFLGSLVDCGTLTVLDPNGAGGVSTTFVRIGSNALTKVSSSFVRMVGGVFLVVIVPTEGGFVLKCNDGASVDGSLVIT